MLREILEKVSKCKTLHFKKIKKQAIKDLINKYDFYVDRIDDGKKYNKVKKENDEIIRKLKMTFPKFGLIEKDNNYIILKDECITEIPKSIKTEPKERPIYTLTYPKSLAAFIKKYILKTKDNIKVNDNMNKIFINNKEKYQFELPECANKGMKDTIKVVNPFNKDEDILFSSKDKNCYKEIIKNLEKSIEE